MRHFLDLSDIDGGELEGILDRAAAMKAGSDASRPLAGRTLAMIFEKSSTRTRVSFEVAAQQLGGHAIMLSSKEMQMGRGETIADTARVLSRYVDVIMIRTDAHRKLTDLAHHATVPVINGLTDDSHPCQLMADMLTVREKKGSVRGRRIAYVGDIANNMGRSFIHAAVRFGFDLRLAGPEELAPQRSDLEWARERQGRIHVTTDPLEAVADADAVVADTWVSMGDRDAERRHGILEPYRVDDTLMRHARSDALFMHCLPAHRGEEVTGSVIDGPQSVVFDEAENRLHAQKAIIAWCLEKS
ncbi:MAG: ornithine carbamoyltransferase [Geminicoccaceae bacterium]|nr:ornithine carbamoyltransferase [Geminicoccaceae bacterium]